MSHNLTAQQESAVVLTVEDLLSDEAIAQEIGVDRRTIQRWRKQSDFAARVEEVRAIYAERILSHGIARRENRVKAMNDRWERFQQIADEWAAAGLTDRFGKPVPGGSTGYQRQQATTSRAGVIYEYVADTGLSAELRALEKQAAQEVGQWLEKQEVSGTLHVEHGWTDLVKELERVEHGEEA